MRTTRPKIPPGLLVLGLAGLLAACAPPVRLATPSEVQQATRPSPTPAASANPNPSPGAGAGSGTAPAPSPSAAPSPPAGSGALGALQNELHQLIGAVQPSVVQIDTSGALGSGIVLDGSGNIVTNAHVLGSATSVTVTASDGTTFRGSVVGSFQANDLAVVRAANPTGSLKAATFGDSGQVEVGDIVLAMGSPLGLSDSVSEGIVSGLNRAQSEGNGVNLTGLVQTTAAIGPGNSGGALVDITGHVVGIPTLSASGSPRGGGGGANIGFAIPSNQVVNVTRQLVSGGTVTRTGLPFLGVTTTGTAANGAQVTDVVGGGPADKAGVQAGWVITGLDGHTVSDPSSISQILSGHKPGDRVNLTANLPDGSNRTVPITLGERPATTP